MNRIKVIIIFLLTITVVIFGSHFLQKFLFKEKVAAIAINEKIVINKDMTLKEFGDVNKIPKPLLNKTFDIKDESESLKKISEISISEDEIITKLKRNLTLMQEANSKDWVKIRIKFALWVLFLIAVFILTKLRVIKSKLRIILYATAVVIFGVILGSDPSPMGTIKDGVILFGQRQVLFLPRLIAFSFMLALVFVANKFICGWGCQLGTLQDFIFRINRGKNNKGVLPQIKIPFAVSNSIRIAVFIMIVIFSVFFTFDIIDVIDPFKIFKPSVIGIVTGIFIGITLIASLFVYRPWCHFFCPFGLAGWLVEQVSIFKIRVDRALCINCNKCVVACPSNAMERILDDKKIRMDCFSCSSCIESCPVKAISFSAGEKK